MFPVFVLKTSSLPFMPKEKTTKVILLLQKNVNFCHFIESHIPGKIVFPESRECFEFFALSKLDKGLNFVTFNGTACCFWSILNLIRSLSCVLVQHKLYITNFEKKFAVHNLILLKPCPHILNEIFWVEIFLACSILK